VQLAAPDARFSPTCLLERNKTNHGFRAARDDHLFATPRRFNKLRQIRFGLF
jgi:hypothetical protein